MPHGCETMRKQKKRKTPQCVKCGEEVSKKDNDICDDCIPKFDYCPRCRMDTDKEFRHLVKCRKCGKIIRVIEQKKTKFKTQEFAKMRYTGKGKVMVDGVPYKIKSLYYTKKAKDASGAIISGISTIKSVSGKFIARRPKFLLSLTPSVSYKGRTYPVARIKLEAMPIEHEVVETSRSRRRRTPKK